jgi:galactose mutarotase-like enzyme
MQFCIGGHAGFCVDGSIEDYELKFEKAENLDLYYTDAESLFSEDYKINKRIESDTFALEYSDYDVDAIIAKDIKSQKVKLVKKSDGTGMEFDFTGFKVLTLWTPPKKQAPFMCLEPWNGLPAYTNESGNFEDKPYRIVLPADSEYSVGYKVSVIK